MFSHTYFTEEGEEIGSCVVGIHVDDLKAIVQNEEIENLYLTSLTNRFELKESTTADSFLKDEYIWGNNSVTIDKQDKKI